MGVIRKLDKSLTTRGLLGTASFISGFAINAVQSAFNPKLRKVRAEHAHAEAEFDYRYGVDTRGVIPVSNLDVTGDTWMHGNAYQGVDPHVDFDEVLRPHVDRYEDFVFVDLGSGKGRAVMLASRLPFREVIGVEFAQDLHLTARANVKLWSRLEKTAPISLVCGDATEFHFPCCPVVVFMYNPFGAKVMQRVADRIAKIHERVIVVYFTPKHADIWDAVPRFQRVKRISGCIMWNNATCPS
jgi:SAM-dependent methyltransferase